MNDIDIYNLASNVLGDITHELNEGIYAELGGELTITWCTEKKFGAYASSLEEADKPPKHRVTMYYELARQIWRDAEQLCKFLRSIPQDSDVDKLYDFYGDRTKLPECFNEKDLVNNIFVAAITWVYFHEIGHLMQEHGIIRDEFREGHSGTHKTANVYDFEASNHNRLVGREALVSHVTELAADFEATTLYILELLRHINDPYFIGSKERKEVLSGLIYLMICGLSLLFLRFNGSQPILPTAVIEGSHPNPLIRLELNVPHIFETLDMAGKIFDYGLDRKQLVLLCGKAALSATLFWSMSRTEKPEFDDRFLVKGPLSNSVVLQYLQPIVACWDEILPRVQEVRRFGPALGLMSFTESFKERVASITTWGNGPERKDATSPSPDVRY